MFKIILCVIYFYKYAYLYSDNGIRRVRVFFFWLPKEYYDDIIIPIIRKYYRSTAIYTS